jgi:hypothetical protein
LAIKKRPKNRLWRLAPFLMRQGGKLKRSPAQHPTRQNPQYCALFGLSLSVKCMEISRSLDCLVRSAVLSEAVSLEIPAFPQN